MISHLFSTWRSSTSETSILHLSRFPPYRTVPAWPAVFRVKFKEMFKWDLLKGKVEFNSRKQTGAGFKECKRFAQSVVEMTSV